MDSGTRDAAVSRTSPVRAGWMGLWTGRAGRAVVAAGTGTGTMTLAGQWTDARRAMGRLHRCGPRRPPESSPHSPGGSSSGSNHRASRPSAAARAVSVACYAAAAVLVTFAALLTLPLQAEAQKTTFVSNTGQSTDPDVREVGPHGHLWQLQAQQFRTGDNEGGYTLSAIQVRVDDFGSNSRPHLHDLIPKACTCCNLNTTSTPSGRRQSRKWSYPAFTDGWFLGLMVSDVVSFLPRHFTERGNVHRRCAARRSPERFGRPGAAPSLQAAWLSLRSSSATCSRAEWILRALDEEDTPRVRRKATSVEELALQRGELSHIALS